MNNIYFFALCFVVCSWTTVYGENIKENVDIEVEIANVTEDEESRRYYGLSVHDQCKNYEKTFRCSRACKIRGYEVFRMNYACKCTCHPINLSNLKHFKPEVKRTTIAELPVTLYPWPTTTVTTTTTQEVNSIANADEQDNEKKTDEGNGTTEKGNEEGGDPDDGEVTSTPAGEENSGGDDVSTNAPPTKATEPAEEK